MDDSRDDLLPDVPRDAILLGEMRRWTRSYQIDRLHSILDRFVTAEDAALIEQEFVEEVCRRFEANRCAHVVDPNE